MQALSQLSYGPVSGKRKPYGLQTPCVIMNRIVAVCTSHSYQCIRLSMSAGPDLTNAMTGRRNYRG
jgi:hypothetical protein